MITGSPRPEREWTVLAYLDGNNNLAGSALHQLNDLETVDTKDRVTIAAMIGTLDKMPKMPKKNRESGEPREVPPGKASNAPADRGAAGKPKPVVTASVDRYVVQKGTDAKRVESLCVEHLGNRNMADPALLSDFLTWGISTFPARHYMVILKDHGMGMRGLLADDTVKQSMALPGFAGALQDACDAAGKKIDLVVFDMCKMGQAEALYEIRNSAGYALASEDVQKIPGLPIASIAGELTTGHGTVEDMVTAMVAHAEETNRSRTFTTSAIRLSSLDSVKSAVDALGAELSRRRDLFGFFREDIEKSQHFHGVTPRSCSVEVRDIYSMASTLLQDERIASGDIRDACSRVRSAVEQAVVASQFSPVPFTVGGEPASLSDCHGLSLYAPVTEGNSYEGWESDRLEFVRDSKWARFVSELGRGENRGSG